MDEREPRTRGDGKKTRKDDPKTELIVKGYINWKNIEYESKGRGKGWEREKGP